MDALLDAIHIALRDGASADERRRALAACRAIAERLEARSDADPGSVGDTTDRADAIVVCDAPGARAPGAPSAPSARDDDDGLVASGHAPSSAAALAAVSAPTSLDPLAATAPPLHDAQEVSPLDAAIAALLPVTSPSPPAPVPASGLALTATNPFAGMTADQILDLAIARLRTALGERDTPSPAGQPFRLTLVPVPPLPARLP